MTCTDNKTTQVRPRILDEIMQYPMSAKLQTLNLTREQILDRVYRELQQEPEFRVILARNACSAETATGKSRAERKYWRRQSWLSLFRKEEMIQEREEKALRARERQLKAA